jgi:hypothetical protein
MDDPCQPSLDLEKTLRAGDRGQGIAPAATLSEGPLGGNLAVKAATPTQILRGRRLQYTLQTAP